MYLVGATDFFAAKYNSTFHFEFPKNEISAGGELPQPAPIQKRKAGDDSPTNPTHNAAWETAALRVDGANEAVGERTTFPCRRNGYVCNALTRHCLAAAAA